MRQENVNKVADVDKNNNLSRNNRLTAGQLICHRSTKRQRPACISGANGSRVGNQLILPQNANYASIEELRPNINDEFIREASSDEQPAYNCKIELAHSLEPIIRDAIS